MKLMNSAYRLIAMDAYHVFKFFFSDEIKNEGVLKILRSNKEKLKIFLRGILQDSTDEELEEERNILISKLNDL